LRKQFSDGRVALILRDWLRFHSERKALIKTYHCSPSGATGKTRQFRDGGSAPWIQVADEPTAMEAPKGATVIEEVEVK
jgi:hypothetical protein